jgi:hypothetical protein
MGWVDRVHVCVCVCVCVCTRARKWQEWARRCRVVGIGWWVWVSVRVCVFRCAMRPFPHEQLARPLDMPTGRSPSLTNVRGTG